MQKRFTLVALFALYFLTPLAESFAADAAGAFTRGHSRLSVTGGSGSAFNDTYFILGAGASYFVSNGLNVGLDVEWWTGGDPGIVKVSPSLQYVVYQVPTVHPYLGVFYRRTYIENLDDLGSVGGRAGVYVSGGRNVYFGAGVVYESYLDCDESTFVSCSDTYPEVSVTVAF